MAVQNVLLLSSRDVLELLTMDEAIDSVEEGFRHLAAGLARQEPRLTLTPPATENTAYFRRVMPGLVHGMGVLGVKLLIGSSSSDPHRVNGVEILFDSDDGSLLAIIQEGSALTKIRTGAVSALGAKYLARREATSLGIFGVGEFASTQAFGICKVRPINRIRVYSRTKDNRERFARELRNVLKVEVEAASTAEEILRESDIIVTVTNSKFPLFSGELLRDGTHISAVGSSVPTSRELDDVTVLRSKIVVELFEQTMRESGDLVIPIQNGVIGADHIYAELTDIITGKKSGRESNSEITLFKFNGIAVEDIACCARLYKRALEANAGFRV
jgi:ornithine cyclodeaminase/alanine dehydrogenase-like protein (mu-crystallin family)